MEWYKYYKMKMSCGWGMYYFILNSFIFIITVIKLSILKGRKRYSKMYEQEKRSIKLE